MHVLAHAHVIPHEMSPTTRRGAATPQRLRARVPNLATLPDPTTGEHFKASYKDVYRYFLSSGNNGESMTEAPTQPLPTMYSTVLATFTLSYASQKKP